MKRDKSKINVVYGSIQISFFVGSAIFAKCTPEGEGLAGEGWDIINSEVTAGICTEFSEPLFEVVVNSVWRFDRVPSPFPDGQDVTWQLISVNTNRQTSNEMKVIKEKLLGLEHTRNGTPATLSVQETKSWDTPNLELKGFMCYGNKDGHASLLLSDKLSTIKRSWETEERFFTILRIEEESGNVRRVHGQCGQSSARRTWWWRQEFLHCGRYQCRIGSDVYRWKQRGGTYEIVWSLVLAKVRRGYWRFQKIWWYGIMKEFVCK